MNADFRQGIRHGIPIALGYLSVSFAFGMKAAGDGLTVLQAVLISMTNLTSAGQIAALPLMIGGASLTWSGLPFPSPGNLPHPGIEPRSLKL